MTNWKSKKILISGATGYVGGIANQYFTSIGNSVETIGRSPTDDHYFDFFQSLHEQESSGSGQIEADIFIHAAAANEVVCQQNPAYAYAVNVGGTKAALDIAVENSISNFIYISTFHVFNTRQGKIDETTVPRPSNVYGLSHYLAEQLVQFEAKNEELGTLIVRPSNLFGQPADINNCNRWSLVPLEFCRDAALHRKIVLKSSGNQERNFVSALDLMRSLEYFLGKSEVAHCYGLDTISIREFAELIAKIGNKGVGTEIVVEAPEQDFGKSTTDEDTRFEFTSIYDFSPRERIDNYCEEMLELLCTSGLSLKSV